MGRWHYSELLSLGGPPGHNELGLQLEESTSCFQYKKTDLEAAGHHETTGSPNALARWTRLRPRVTDFSPQPGSRQPRLTERSAAAAPPPRSLRPGRLPAGPAGATRQPGRRARGDALSLEPLARRVGCPRWRGLGWRRPRGACCGAWRWRRAGLVLRGPCTACLRLHPGVASGWGPLTCP